jgi:uncharacterized metal-binding protein YceD (DUF177 family)
MLEIREFEIAFAGLKPGISVYEYELGGKFFDAANSTEFSNCTANVKLNLDKHPTFLQLKFEIGGKAEMTCNRCGNPLEITLWDDFEVLVKMVDNPVEMNAENDDPDVCYISWNETHLNIHDWIYEFVQLSMPTHPICGEDENGESKCNKEVLSMLENLTEQEETIEYTFWKGLDKFRNN